MRRVFTTASAVALVAGAAQAGGIDRSGQSVGVIFEKGTYAELSFGAVSPTISGVGASIAPPPPAVPSGDMAPSYMQFGMAYKQDLKNGLSVALIYDQPFGADVEYPASTYFATGSTAELRAHALTGILKYTTANNFSVYGGLRYQTLQAEAVVPFVGSYSGSAERDAGVGYVLGAAWEKPEIALRVALTYNSEISHRLNTSEATLLGATSGVTPVDTPQSVNLDFQTGIAADTLLFGSIRWVDWSDFDITPSAYSDATGGGSLVSYDNDVVTYSLGVGRRLNENWSAAVTLGYEREQGGFSSNLGPTDGNISLGLGATYTQGNIKVTGGIRYVSIGNAQTTLDGVDTAAEFSGNDAIAAGVKIGYTF